MVNPLDAAGLGPDVTPGPENPELLAAGRQLPDQLGERAVMRVHDEAFQDCLLEALAEETSTPF